MGAGTWQIPTTWCRRLCSTRSGAWTGSRLGEWARYRRICDRRSSIAFATSCVAKPATRSRLDPNALEDVAARSPLEEAIGHQAVEDYEEALGRLKPAEREAIIARVEMGYTYDELARRWETIGRSSAQGRPSCAAAARRGNAPCRRMTICSSTSPMRSSTGRRSTGRPSSPGRTAPAAACWVASECCPNWPTFIVTLRLPH